MIVGADLNADDVAAILAGDESRMAARLNRELEDRGAWPEDVQHGVSLLAWMVSSGCLEVRVVFRVHGQTGRPLPFESREDGYVHEKWAIFTDADTLTDIVGRFRQVHPSMRLGTYSGKGGQYTEPGSNKMRGVERDEIKHRFLRGEIDVLVCTDAAAEGINLQTADLIINYDLPWNPMKVEQRIGRIDRIGQSHDRISVLNLCYVDSAEQIVYDRLLTRLAEAGGVVGEQQISMLPVNEMLYLYV